MLLFPPLPPQYMVVQHALVIGPLSVSGPHPFEMICSRDLQVCRKGHHVSRS